MFSLQSFNCLDNLPNLIGFCVPSVILDVYPWVTDLWGLVYAVASACLPGLAEIMIADPANLSETPP
jgi:hypothetical protein